MQQADKQVWMRPLYVFSSWPDCTADDVEERHCRPLLDTSFCIVLRGTYVWVTVQHRG